MGSLGNGYVSHDRPIWCRQTTPALSGEHFCFVFFDKAYICDLKILATGTLETAVGTLRAEGSPCRHTRGIMAELRPKQSWTQGPANYFSPKLIFPVSSVLVTESYIIFPVGLSCSWLLNELMKTPFSPQKSLGCWGFLLPKLLPGKKKKQWSIPPEYFYITLGTQNLALDILRLQSGFLALRSWLVSLTFFLHWLLIDLIKSLHYFNERNPVWKQDFLWPEEIISYWKRSSVSLLTWALQEWGQVRRKVLAVAVWWEMN